MSNRTKLTSMFFKSLWKIIGSLIVFTLFSAVKASAELPIEIQSTRVVFNEGEPSAFVAVRNKSSIPYLIAVDITQYCGEGKTCAGTEDFMTAPSFKVISPGQAFSFRIVKLAENLPQDKESLYLVHFRLLPSEADLSDKDIETIRVTVAMAGSLKLFWRPQTLAKTAGVLKVRDMLSARCVNNRLEIMNRSAYWGTFGSLAVSGKTLLQEGPLPMVAPFSSVLFPISACPQSLSVSFIAESGLMTSARTVPIQEKLSE